MVTCVLNTIGNLVPSIMTLHDLCKVGSADVVNAYLSAVSAESPDDLGYVLDLRNEQRYTALHCAIFARCAFVTNFLIKWRLLTCLH